MAKKAIEKNISDKKVTSLREKIESSSTKTSETELIKPIEKREYHSKISKNTFTFKFFRILSLILLPPYIRNSWKELKLVNWPNFKLSRQLTLAVVIFALFFGISIALIDSGLSKIFKVILLK